MTRWLRVALADLPLLRSLSDLGERPLPRVVASLGPAVPGWVLRAGAVLATAAMIAIAAQRSGVAAGFGWTVVAVAAVVMAIWPTLALATVAVVVAGVFIALDAHGPFDPVVLLLIPLAYLAVRLAWWAERVPLAARVELAALASGLKRGLALTGGTVGFGALVFAVAGRPFAAAAIVGGVALAVLAGLVFAAVTRAPRPEADPGEALGSRMGATDERGRR